MIGTEQPLRNSPCGEQPLPARHFSRASAQARKSSNAEDKIRDRFDNPLYLRGCAIHWDWPTERSFRLRPGWDSEISPGRITTVALRRSPTAMPTSFA